MGSTLSAGRKVTGSEAHGAFQIADRFKNVAVALSENLRHVARVDDGHAEFVAQARLRDAPAEVRFRPIIIGIETTDQRGAPPLAIGIIERSGRWRLIPAFASPPRFHSHRRRISDARARRSPVSSRPRNRALKMLCNSLSGYGGHPRRPTRPNDKSSLRASGSYGGYVGYAILSDGWGRRWVRRTGHTRQSTIETECRGYAGYAGYAMFPNTGWTLSPRRAHDHV